MYIKVNSGGITNINGYIVSVEVDISAGLPYFAMVGLLSSEVKEASERVRSAIRNIGYYIPPGRVTVSLTPGNIRKEGTGYDLAIAVGILLASEVVKQDDKVRDNIFNTLIIGELGLDGEVKGINGVLPIILKAKQEGFSSFIVPRSNEKETHFVDGINIYTVSNLKEVIEIIKGNGVLYNNSISINDNKEEYPNIDNILGNDYAKRALLVAVGGMHNILFMGPPGSGKSMLAKSIPSIMPEPDMQERIEIASLYSICGLLNTNFSVVNRPFRMPHHSITLKAFAGGGIYPKPGEITLAHRGVLFLDELPEFKSEVLESMREPLEEKTINIVRNKESCVFPADFLLVGAMNNCKCGYYPDRNLCTCSEVEVKKYQNKVHGPLLDRIDICINISRIRIEELEGDKKQNDCFSEYKEIILRLHNIQRERFSGTKVRFNSGMTKEMIDKYCCMTDEAKEMLKVSYEKMNISVRTYYKIIKVARTIADIENEEIINVKHIAESIGYKSDI